MKTSPFLFEVSFEVANFVGGIHTVLATKAQEIQKHIPNYLLIGPYKPSNAQKEFTKANIPNWMKKHITTLKNEGIIIHYGTWNVPSTPNCILIEYEGIYPKVNELKSQLYREYEIESHDARYDVDEPIAFSFATSKLIIEFNKTITQKFASIVHAHEWMCGYTNLFIKTEETRQNLTTHTHTVFTTHATMLGRTLTSLDQPIMRNISLSHYKYLASQHNILAKYTAECACAKFSDVFTTVSDITADEAQILLGTKPHIITYNGINTDELYPLNTLAKRITSARCKIETVAQVALGDSFNTQCKTQYWVISGRHEPKNKGYDISIQALAKINQLKSTVIQNTQLVVFILVPYEQFGINTDFKKRLIAKELRGNQFRDIVYHTRNEITNELDSQLFFNQQSDSVKIIYVPEYLFTHNDVFDLSYTDLLCGFDLGIFPSKYEPWGYTPHEAIAAGVATITSNTAGFGAFIQSHTKQSEICLLNRQHEFGDETRTQLVNMFIEKAQRTHTQIETESALARLASHKCTWKTFIKHYLNAYRMHD